MKYTNVNKLKIMANEAAKRIFKSHQVSGDIVLTEAELASILHAYSENFVKDDDTLKWYDLVDTSY